jgi:hemerythrin superfamily protein
MSPRIMRALPVDDPIRAISPASRPQVQSLQAMRGTKPTHHRNCQGGLMSLQKSAKPKRSTPRAPDALRMLRDDHDAVKKLFEQFSSSNSDAKKAELSRKICHELKVHTQLEEEIFYPAAREAIDDSDVMDEAVVEHGSAKELIEAIEAMEPGEELFDAKVTVLGEWVNHHIREEQNEMFPLVRKSNLDLRELADTMRARKKELTKESNEEADSESARASA